MIVSQFEDTVSSALSECSPETVFVTAVSGGADSMALLAALCFAAGKERIFCVHVEHGIRPREESLGDAEYVRSFCVQHEIKFHIEHIPPGTIIRYAQRKKTGIEAAARFFRRRILCKLAANLERGGAVTRILTAHTKDDLLELVLMRSLRGCGPAGLSAMPKTRALFMRPMLTLSRADVTAYLNAKEIAWREDSTNRDDKFLRNRVRRRLIPVLNDFFPSWKKGIASTADTQSLVSDFICNEAGKRVVWKITGDCGLGTGDQGSGIGEISTDAENFFLQPLIIREEAVFLAADGLLKGVRCKGTLRRAVVRRFCAGEPAAADLGDVKIRRKNGLVVLSRKEKEFFERGYSVLI
ncbi:MAG: tRNA lysidine(34) synthetase TilS [Treponema sp.]|nr:tRNA lysidine(34) synthetase TilS [Treponema sp.]